MFCFFSHFFKISVLMHVFLMLIDLNNMIIICGTLSLCCSFAMVNIFLPKQQQQQKNILKQKNPLDEVNLGF